METYDGNETPNEKAMNKLSALVCKHGPKLLTRGMPALEANEAIIACIEMFVAEREADDLISKVTAGIDKLEAVNGGAHRA